MTPGTAVRALPDSLPDSVVQEAWQWHRRLGHTGFASLAELCRREQLPGCKVTPQQFLQVRGSETCEPCVMGKLQRIGHPLRDPPAVRVLHRVHMDLCYYSGTVLSLLSLMKPRAIAQSHCSLARATPRTASSSSSHGLKLKLTSVSSVFDTTGGGVHGNRNVPVLCAEGDTDGAHCCVQC